MPRGRPKGSKNRATTATGEKLPTIKNITRIVVSGHSHRRGFELDVLAGLEQREGIVLPLLDGATITVLPVVPGHKLGDDDNEEGETYCRFLHSDGFEAPCTYAEQDDTAYIDLVEQELAEWTQAFDFVSSSAATQA